MSIKSIRRLRHQLEAMAAELHADAQDLLVLELRLVGGATAEIPKKKNRGRDWVMEYKTPPWAVPGLPEDLDHPLNLSLDLKARSSSQPEEPPV